MTHYSVSRKSSCNGYKSLYKILKENGYNRVVVVILRCVVVGREVTEQVKDGIKTILTLCCPSST